MPKSLSDLWNELKSAKDKASKGYKAVPRKGRRGRILGPEYVPLEDKTEQLDASSNDPPPTERKGGCFVATAAYGVTDSSVVLLQTFRDRVLIHSVAGQLIVKFYYTVSPPLAHFIAKSNRRRRVARALLKPFIRVAGRKLSAGNRSGVRG